MTTGKIAIVCYGDFPLEAFISILVLIGIAIYAYFEHMNLDKKDSIAFHPSAQRTVDANNGRRRQQRLDLQNRVDFLNAKHPTKTFYRDGVAIKERSSSIVPSTKGFDKNTGDKYLAQHEFPHLLSTLLDGSSKHEMFWSHDGRSIIFKFDEIARQDKDYAELTRLFLFDIGYSQDGYSRNELMKWAKQLTITQVETDDATMRPQVTIQPSDSLLEDEDYLRMEVENHGRVFIRNNVGNNIRWLLGFPKKTENTIGKEGGGWLIQLSTSHYKPTSMSIFEDYCSAKMKRKQMIENLESRLWNRKQVESFAERGDVAYLRVS